MTPGPRTLVLAASLALAAAAGYLAGEATDDAQRSPAAISTGAREITAVARALERRRDLIRRPESSAAAADEYELGAR